MTDTKTCSICGLRKPITDFGFSDKPKGYRQPCCKMCFNFRSRERWRKLHPDALPRKNEESIAPTIDIQKAILEDKEEKFFKLRYQDGNKKCATCSVFKELSEYYKDVSTRDCYLARCKVCVDKPKTDRAKHIIKPWIRTTASAKARAKKLKLPFSLTKEFVQTLYEQSNGICPVLHTPMQVGGNLQSVPSIDRIKPELGYVPNNVRLISYRANSLKQDASLEEIRLVLRDLELTYTE